jgi:hypothetical protein
MNNAIFSTDMGPDYAFLVPITSLIWKKRIGFNPICFFVGTEAKWNDNGLTKFILEKSREAGTQAEFIDFIDGVKQSTIAQVSRLYGGCLNCNDDDYIITSDTDMWPINKSWFLQGQPDKKFHIFFANAYSPEIKYPMCFLGANAKYWRELMHVDQNSSVKIALEKQIYADLGKNSSDQEAWNYDEKLFGTLIQNFNGFPSNCHLINRAGRRIDRSDWSVPNQIDDIIDSHLLRPSHHQNWKKIHDLLQKILSYEDFDWCCRYRNEFVETYCVE